MRDCAFTDPKVTALATKYKASAAQICAVWTRQVPAAHTRHACPRCPCCRFLQFSVRCPRLTLLAPVCNWQRGCTMSLGTGADASKVDQYTKEDLDIFRFNMTDAEVRPCEAKRGT